MKPLISVIIPCYNTAQYLPQCMLSLEMQTLGFENLQCIFVDDASTDNGSTWECIKQFERKHPQEVVAIHLDENLSQGGAKNVGIGYAKADYIGFVDSDDWIEPAMYLDLYRCIEKYGCDVVDCGRMENFPDGREVIYSKNGDIFDNFSKNILEGGNHWITDFSHMGYGEGIVTGIYNKEIIDKNSIEFPCHLKYEDNYWYAIMRLYTRSNYHLQNNYYHYRQREDSTVHLRNTTFYLDQMQIEELKLVQYKKLGIFHTHYYEIERDYLDSYYCSTLIKLFNRCDEPLYDVYKKMSKRVKEVFPNYMKNPYLKDGEFYTVLIKLINKDVGVEDFKQIGDLKMEYCRMSAKIAYNAI